MNRRKITDPKEAHLIVKAAERLIKRGEKLTPKKEADYLFAKIFLSEIKKRRGKKTKPRAEFQGVFNLDISFG